MKKRLTTVESWRKRHSATTPKAHSLPFNPEQIQYKFVHNIFIKHMPSDENYKFLEVGCFPGRYMWYFNKYFKYKVYGIEYVNSAAKKCEIYLKSASVKNAKVIANDFFQIGKGVDSKTINGWNVVGSFGFIEHFNDPYDVVKRHIDLTRDRGYIIMSAPNHSGFNGVLLKCVDYEKYEEHNRMDLKFAEEIIDKFKNVEVLYLDYVGKFGLYNTGIYRKAKEKLGFLYYPLRAILYSMELFFGSILPKNRHTSPEILILLRKK